MMQHAQAGNAEDSGTPAATDSGQKAAAAVDTANDGPSLQASGQQQGGAATAASCLGDGAGNTGSSYDAAAAQMDASRQKQAIFRFQFLIAMCDVANNA